MRWPSWTGPRVLRVHRSHWVARGFVTGGQRDGGRATLHLADGSTVPVSRWFLPQVRAAGLLSDAPPAAPRSVGRAQG
ncbi:LytTR family DNA-binding domain-containing protein [Phaeovulum vinaykumarii]|uniref:LytTR family DNA-binding domain-containing protein n=1 Tax=Phaeovulum vinaykumarii TaxID=407234 RepID=UPI000A035A8C